MVDSARLDTTRLRAELFFIQRTLGDVASQRGNILEDVDGELACPFALIWRSLYADCLRAVYSIAMADGVIYDVELDWMRDLLIAAAPHYAGTPSSLYGRRPVDAASSRAFLMDYVRDNGPYGYGAETRWPGHRLCCRAEAAGDREVLTRYSRLMRWLIDEACGASNVSQDDPRWRARLPDIDDLLQALTAAGRPPVIDVERREQVFLGESRVFAPIQKAFSVYEADPFDVETLHGEARDSFRRLVKQVTTESRPSSSGRTLVIVGGAGYGKTHLLRSFWSHVQEYGRGFVAYAQMDTSVDDYARYFLHQLVDSLKHPYAGRPGGRTGLEELAAGFARLRGQGFVERVERLAEMIDGPRSSLDHQVNQLVDELLGHPKLDGADPDLLRVLLYALCGDQRTKHRVYQYLCCDEMTEYDRSLIGNVVPRTAREDRAAMIRKLAQLAFATRSASLVLMLDQVERSGDAEQAVATFERAINALLGIESLVSSVIVVIGCLSNLYDKALKVMGRSTLDRLVNDPPPARLPDQLSYEEIQAIVGHRLAWMYAEAGAIYRAADPLYPIPAAQLRNRVGHRPRDILEWCQQFHERCVAARRIVEIHAGGEAPGPPVPLPARSPPQHPPLVVPLPSAPPPSPKPPIDRIALAWNEAFAASRARALEDDDVLRLVAAAAHAYAAETGVSLTLASHKDNLLRLQQVAGGQQIDLVISVTNRGPQRGAFGAQIRKLRQSARSAIAIAVRTDAFPTGARSVEAVVDLVGAGGRAICLDKPTLRALIAHQSFQPAFSAEHLQAWRHSRRPIASLPLIADMFALESLGPEARSRGRTSSAASPASSAAAG